MSPSSSSEGAPYENSRFATIDGVSLHYRVWLPEELTPTGMALLVHGLGGSTFSWRIVGPGMAQLGYYAVAVDLPGFGYSTRESAERMSARQWTNLMWHLASTIESSARSEHQPMLTAAGGEWLLIGHSLGGRIVANMAAEYPERVHKTVLIDAALYGPPAIMPMLGVAPLRWLVAKWLETQVLNERGVARLLQSAYGRRPSDDEIEGYLRPLLLPGTVPILLRLSRSIPEVAIDDLARITKPTLIVWGELDTWIPVKYALRIFNDIGDAEIFVVPEAAHLVMETHADALLERLEEFL